MQLDLFKSEEEDKGKINAEEYILCPTCNTSKSPSEYYLYENRKQNGAHRNCVLCYNAAGVLRYHLRKANPYPFHSPVCDCCGVVAKDEVLNLDHCHDSKAFRGWLCRSCNTGIGSLGDDISGLEKALIYLRKHYEQH